MDELVSITRSRRRNALPPKKQLRRTQVEAASEEADRVIAGAVGTDETSEISYEAPRGEPANPQEVEGTDAEAIRLHTQRRP